MPAWGAVGCSMYAEFAAGAERDILGGMAKAKRQPEPRTPTPSSLSGWVYIILAVLSLRVLVALTLVVLPPTTLAPMRSLAALAVVGPLVDALAAVLFASPLDALVDLLFFAVVYYFSVDVLARVVLPAPRRDRARVHRLIQGATATTLPSPVIIASNGEFEVRGAPRGQVVAPAAALCDGVTVLALDGSETRLVVGPGLAWLEPGETVHAAVDLRPLQMHRSAVGTTREGMQVEMQVAITLEVCRAQTRHTHHANYPYDPAAVRRAVYAERAQSVDPATDARPAADWREIAACQVEDGLRRVIAAYTVDQLFAVDQPDRRPRHDIETALRQMIEPEIERYGATCTRAAITSIRPPRAVLEQRIRTWCAEWSAREQAIKAAGEAHADQVKESAQAMARAEVLQSLVSALDVASIQASSERVSRSISEMLERMVAEPETNALLDDQVRRAVSELADEPRGRPAAARGAQ